MKKETLHEHNKIANAVIYYIYRYIDTDITIEGLSEALSISKFHLHRVFKSIFGRNIYESIKSIRLQKASSLLLTNKNSTITEIAKMCGYSSQTAFSKVFKEHFAMTPKDWKKGGYVNYVEENLISSTSAMSSTADFSDLTPEIVKMPAMTGYYIRHMGYDKSIKETWQKLYVWSESHTLRDVIQIGLHHDNPVIIPLAKCQYIACIVADSSDDLSSLPKFTIPKGMYAKFTFSGKYGDVLKFMKWVYFEWLVNSGYETTTNPSYTIYEKNHFLSKDETFVLSYYIPIQL